MRKAKRKAVKRNPVKKKVATKKKWLGWYFSDATERLRYGDGRKIKVGITHKVKCEPIMCQQGLHASPSVLDALNYAPGNILFRVSLGGKKVHEEDKSVARERTYISRIDAKPILREFARKCALSVIHLWDCPRLVRDYLETGDETSRAAARAAAWDAAGDAAGAARAAAWDAARAARAAANDAARAAAWAAARAASDAAWDAARAAARAASDAARAAAWAAARAASDAARDAARAAAGDAAWDAGAAAWAAQKKLLDKMILTAIAKQTKRKVKR